MHHYDVEFEDGTIYDPWDHGWHLETEINEREARILNDVSQSDET